MSARVVRTCRPAGKERKRLGWRFWWFVVVERWCVSSVWSCLFTRRRLERVVAGIMGRCGFSGGLVRAGGRWMIAGFVRERRAGL